MIIPFEGDFPMASDHEIRVGDSVHFRFGTYDVTGIVKEDRGAIGKGGRRLYLIAFDLDPTVGVPSVIELPAVELQLMQHGTI